MISLKYFIIFLVAISVLSDNIFGFKLDENALEDNNNEILDRVNLKGQNIILAISGILERSKKVVNGEDEDAEKPNEKSFDRTELKRTFENIVSYIRELQNSGGSQLTRTKRSIGFGNIFGGIRDFIVNIIKQIYTTFVRKVLQQVQIRINEQLTKFYNGLVDMYTIVEPEGLLNSIYHYLLNRIILQVLTAIERFLDYGNSILSIELVQ